MSIKQKTNGAALRAAREAAGMTRQEIADRFRVSAKAVEAWEKDIANFWPYHYPLAALLNVNPLSLITPDKKKARRK